MNLSTRLLKLKTLNKKRSKKGADISLTELKTRVATLEAQIRALTNKRPRGRPMAASKDMAISVLALHRDGLSLRRIADETGISVRAVRTVLEKYKGTDCTARRQKELRRRKR